MDLSRLFNTEQGKILLSILIGFGLSTLFRKICIDRNCLNFVSVPEKNILGKTFQQDSKCFQYRPKLSACNTSVKIVVSPAKQSAGNL